MCVKFLRFSFTILMRVQIIPNYIAPHTYLYHSTIVFICVFSAFCWFYVNSSRNINSYSSNMVNFLGVTLQIEQKNSSKKTTFPSMHIKTKLKSREVQTSSIKFYWWLSSMEAAVVADMWLAELWKLLIERENLIWEVPTDGTRAVKDCMRACYWQMMKILFLLDQCFWLFHPPAFWVLTGYDITELWERYWKVPCSKWALQFPY